MSRFTKAVDRGLDGYTNESVGLCEGSEQCEGETEEGSFSWHSCDICGSSLGGDRFPAHAVDANGDIEHFDICTDCLLYLANGEEPETWED